MVWELNKKNNPKLQNPDSVLFFLEPPLTPDSPAVSFGVGVRKQGKVLLLSLRVDGMRTGSCIRCSFGSQHKQERGKKAHAWGGGGGSALVFANVVGKILSKEGERGCFHTGSTCSLI